jgi:glycosyltransferase involved in cell wall biosynthesis
MKISYAVTVSNELVEIQHLIGRLSTHKREEDEIVVQFDSPKATIPVVEYLNKSVIDGSIQRLVSYPLNGDFGQFKQHLNQNCSGDWIFQLDADEDLEPTLIENLHTILEGNQQIDMFWLPRINIVNGLTPEDIAKWGWQVNEQGWVNYPDVQGRLYRNKQAIFWAGKVHEKVQGYESYSIFPPEEIYSIKHIKDIERQRKQNDFYEQL